MKYAVVGFGTAGYHAVKKIRELDKEGCIDVYSNTGRAPYNPMLTTYYAFGKLEYEGMFPFGDLEQIQKEVDFNLRREQVIKVHGSEHLVETENGSEQYDRILIATGARAFAPPVKGLEPEDAFLMRTVEDALRFKDRLKKNDIKHAVVIGASMAGIKVVEVLHKYGIETWLLDLASYIFPLAAYKEVAKEIEKRVEAQGVHLMFGVTIDHMEQENGEKTAVLTDGSRIPADIVGLCIGTRAITETVQGEVEIGRGIVVDDHMRTSVPGIYAAGDCCEGNNLESGQNQIIGLWANAGVQGRVAGRNMAGLPDETDGNILHNITHFLDMDFIGLGDNRLTGDVRTYLAPDKGFYLQTVLKDGRPVGFNILDNYGVSGILKAHLIRLLRGQPCRFTPEQRGQLIRYGLEESFIDQLEATI